MRFNGEAGKGKVLCQSDTARFESNFVSDMQKIVGGIPDGVDGLSTSHDHDRDKYKRRPALQWLTRWFRYVTVSLAHKHRLSLPLYCD